MTMTPYIHSAPSTQIGLSLEATATADTTTASLTDVLTTGMTLTPSAGTYIAWFDTSITNNANGGITYFSLYVGGVQVAASERRTTSLIQGVVVGNQPQQQAVATHGKVTVNGGQAVEARWRASAGTSTAHQRTLTLMRVNA